MNKFLAPAAALLLTASAAHAGGYLTNTNQSVHFLRNPARDGAIAIDGTYANPAGVGFLSKGWHFAFDVQSAYQKRSIKSRFGQSESYPYLGGIVNGVQNASTGETYAKGRAAAPVIPSIDLARVGEKWFATFHFGITGGGGKCKYDDGLPLFESQVAMAPVLVGAIAPGVVTGYTMDTYMEGRQYYFGGQLGLGYKFTPKLSANIGGRLVYADCNYYGYVHNIQFRLANGATMSGEQFFTAQNMPHFASLVSDRNLNCDQSGWGFTPIISVDYHSGKWNFAARYEFKTRLRLKNKSGVNTSGLSEYDDGLKIAADIPAILAVGAQYELLDNFRLNGAFHYYFDKQATQYEDKQKNLKSGGWEVLAGAEYDINDRFTVSAGWQTTNYGLGNNSQFLNNISFVTNSNSFGVGTSIKLKERVRLNVSYFKTIYTHYKKSMSDYNNIRATFGSMLTPMGEQLATAAATYQAAIASGQLSDTQKAAYMEALSVIQGESTALGTIATGLAGYSTAGYDLFHRTNDVFGIGVEIDF